jgi:hypothetical protein
MSMISVFNNIFHIIQTEIHVGVWKEVVLDTVTRKVSRKNRQAKLFRTFFEVRGRDKDLFT